MTSVREIARDLWLEAQLGAPAPIQRTVFPRLYEMRELARLASRPRLPAYQMRGQTRCGALNVTYVGLKHDKPFLKKILFDDPPQEQLIGRVPFWRTDELTSLSSEDILIVEAPRAVIRQLPCQEAIVLPEFVHHVLDTRSSWQDIQKGFHKSARREMRWLRKYDYQYRASQDDREFETFYSDMYLPTMRDRHRDQAVPMSFREAYRYFHHGLLFLVTRDRQVVAGSVCYLERGTVHFMIMGVLGGDQQLVREGVVGVLNCLRIQWASENGHQAVNFLGSRPGMNGGLYQFKRKWGSAVCVSPDVTGQIWIRVRRGTPAVSDFLIENPFVVVDKDQSLHGLIVTDDPHNVSEKNRSNWIKRYRTPGLEDLRVCSVDRFIPGTGSEHGSHWMILE